MIAEALLVIALGDSLSTTVGADPGQAWTEQLGIETFAVGGTTAAAWHPGGRLFEAARPAMTNADLVLLTLGGNDAIPHRPFAPTPEVFRIQFDNIIAEVLDEGVPRVLISFPTFAYGFDERYEPRWKAMRAEAMETCGSWGPRVECGADWFEIIVYPEDTFDEKGHWNQIGHDKIAAAMAPLLVPEPPGWLLSFMALGSLGVLRFQATREESK